MSGAAKGEELVEQIRVLVERELVQLGVRTALRVEGDSLIAGRGAAETRAEISGTLAQWESLPDDLRERRVQQIAGLLAQGAPRSERPRAAQPKADGRRWFSIFAPMAVVALTVVAVALAYRYLAPGGAGSFAHSGVPPLSGASASAYASAIVDSDRERTAIAGAACEQARARVARGANVGPADVEGWVVELVLLRRGQPIDLSALPGLSKFIGRAPRARLGTVIWPTATHLAAAQRFDAQVEVAALPALGTNQLSGLSLVFSGPYVAPYFTEDQRSDYLMLADALAEELGVTDGALFAHCASAEGHHIGSWFLGATPGAAVGSLVYFMASYSEAPLLKPEVLGAPIERGHAFDAIGSAANDMDRSAAATLIGRELGMISGRSGHPTRLTFPFRDANRATRASVAAARALQLANSG